MRHKILSLALAALLLLPVSAFAQAKSPAADPSKPNAKQRERVRERIEMMKMWKLTEALDLDEQTAQKLFPLLNTYEEQNRQLRQKRTGLIKQMQAEIGKEKADPAALKKLVDEFKKNELEITRSRNQQIDDISTVLSEEQVAKLIVFVPQFEKNVRNMMGEVRARHRHKDCAAAPECQQQCPLGHEPRHWQRGDFMPQWGRQMPAAPAGEDSGQ